MRRAEILSKVVNRLRAQRGGPVAALELADYVWADDPEGGPDNALWQLQMAIGWGRRELKYPIHSVRGRASRGYAYVASKTLDEILA